MALPSEVREAGEERWKERVFASPRPHPLGCQPLESKHHWKTQEPALWPSSGATLISQARRLETVKSGTTNMPPHIQFNSSSKLDSKSNRHGLQTVTQDKAWGVQSRRQTVATEASRGRRQQKAAVGILPAPGASLLQQGSRSWLCHTNSLEPPSF